MVSRRTVLCALDNRDLARIFEKALEGADYRVLVVHDGIRALSRWREDQPDLKVIFISGYTEDAFRKRLGQDRGIHFLPKPFSLKQLAAKVKEVLGEDDTATRTESSTPSRSAAGIGRSAGL